MKTFVTFLGRGRENKTTGYRKTTIFCGFGGIRSTQPTML